MKAFVHEVYGSPDVLQLKELEKPVPDENEVLVKIHTVSLNQADLRLLKADPFLMRLGTGLFKPKFGITGSDIAGRVEVVGAKVKQFKPGDEVFGDIGKGGFAEYAITSEDKLCLKPTDLSFEEASAVPKAANTALQALRDTGRLQSGQKVLINGASGGVGIFAVQIAKSLGAEVIGVCSTRNLEMVSSIGADHVIDYTREDFANTNQTYDLILDTVVNRPIGDYQRALKLEGISVLVGFTAVSHMLKTILAGMWLSKTTAQTITPMDASINQNDLRVLKEMIEAGNLKPVIDRCYPFNDIAEAMSYLETGHARGKVVITLQ